jgi:pimeloyl-ACP methyl ester carboxylesterase
MTVRRMVVAHGLGGLVALSFIVGIGSRTHAVAAECPVPGFDWEKIEEAARAAPSCERSFQMLARCSSGAGSDVGLGSVVTSRCEADFLTKLSSAQRQVYRSAQARCQRKYQQESGTMYRSFEAFCGAEIARAYARRHAAHSAAPRDAQR